jgi:hypothetical protein
MENEIKYSDDVEGSIICPSCGGGNLHHLTVTAENRDTEDGPATRVVSRGKTVTVDRTENPANRRSNLYVDFDCETCEATPRLELIQHKGSTYLRWIEVST